MIINLTPHQICIYDENNNLITKIAPSGAEARVSETRARVGEIENIPVFAVSYGDITGLPAPDGNVYIVSAKVRSTCKRGDVHSPGELLRDKKGRVIGCIGLTQ